jgi:GAF domain-containing protein
MTATATSGLSAAFERLSLHADDWSQERVMDEGLDLVRDATWSDECALYSMDPDGHATEVAWRPAERPPCGQVLPASWFPWGLAAVNPRRFVLVSDATALPSTAGAGPTLGELGISSCLHLPILERQRPIGALQLFWSEPRVAWDDERGRLLRLLGRFLLGRAGS